ncbi:MAG: hypothetical protein FD121_1661 [Gallionellaceae bacterium]|nr:MAG: hypothetical protein FD121_1661 [Gallionellaceae bacterium]
MEATDDESQQPQSQQPEVWLERAVTGPDLLLNLQPTQCLDLTIISPIGGVRADGERIYVNDVMSRAKYLKDRTYAQWHSYYGQFDQGITCIPFIMSSNGFFSHDTLSWMKQLTDNRREARWWPSFLQLNLQKVLAEAAAVIFLSRSAHRVASKKFFAANPARTNQALHAAGFRDQRPHVDAAVGADACAQQQSPPQVQHPVQAPAPASRNFQNALSNSCTIAKPTFSVAATHDQGTVERAPSRHHNTHSH